MIHHLARAFFIRSSTAANPADRPVSARREPKLAPERAERAAHAAASMARSSGAPRRLRISSDPSDARRTVIAGRFADVCAALDRLVLEQEAAI